jgi:NADH dehydrogenase/NADH:ubiquinone oxidoreductase subunit G
VLILPTIVSFVLLSAQSPAALQLEKNVYALNNESKYELAQGQIFQFLKAENISDEDRYYAYVYLSYTYKRLFDYTSTLRYLDQALSYGINTPKRDFFIANINCQKALSWFDIHRYREADSLMKLLALSNYQYLNEEYQSKIIMQEAYLQFLNKNYKEAENRYDSAIHLMQRSSPCDLPMIYAKKLELFGETGQKNETQLTYLASLKSADSCGILKYTIYTKQMMVRALINQKEYLQALKVVMEMDSLNMLYNSTEHLKQIAELNKKYEVNLKDIRIKEQNASMKIQIVIIFGLVAMLSLLYYFFSKSIKQKNIILQQNKLNERLVTIISHDIKEPLLGVQLLLKKLNVNDIYLTQASQSLVLQVSAVNDILNNILKFQKAVIEKTNEVSNHKDILWASSQSQKELSSQITDKRLSVEINLNANPELRIPISKEQSLR